MEVVIIIARYFLYPNTPKWAGYHRDLISHHARDNNSITNSKNTVKVCIHYQIIHNHYHVSVMYGCLAYLNLVSTHRVNLLELVKGSLPKGGLFCQLSTNLNCFKSSYCSVELKKLKWFNTRKKTLQGQGVFLC